MNGKCRMCGKHIVGNKKYCSQRCAQMHWQQQKEKTGKRRHVVWATDKEWERIKNIIRDITDSRKIRSPANAAAQYKKSGCAGVRLKRGKWIAEIGVNRRKIHLGTFEKFEDALKARKAAEEKYFAPIIEAWEKREEE